MNTVEQQQAKHTLALQARVDELTVGLNRLVELVERTKEDSEGVWPHPDTGCIYCAHGTTPAHRNTGPCAYHWARKLLGFV